METILADGIFFDKPREGAPDFVRGRVSIKVEQAVAFLQKHANDKGYVNLDLLKAKDGGKLYFKLNNYTKPTSTTETPTNAPQPSTGDSTHAPEYPMPDGEPPF